MNIKRTTALAIAALSTLVACDDLAYPMHSEFVANMAQVDAVQDDDGSIEIISSTEVQDMQYLLTQIPEGARDVAKLNLKDITVHSPESGSIGQWVETFEVYLSTDNVLDGDDILIQQASNIDPTQGSFVLEPMDSISLEDFAAEGTISLIVRAELSQVPSVDMRLPIELYAEAKVSF